MTFLGLFAISLAVVSNALAFPSNASLNANCIITCYEDVSTVVKSCTTITIKSFTVPAGKLLDLSLKRGTKVTITGVITFDYHQWVGPLMQITGSGVTVTGAKGVYLEGNGAKYWDGKGDKGVVKPKFVRINTTGKSKIQNLDLKNCPRQCYSIIGSDTQLIGCDVDVSAGSAKGKNTDGYDVSGTGITISTATVKNQDDCVAINQGSNITVTGLTCIGGHGLSVSVQRHSISDVLFENCNVYNSRNGIHVKTQTDGSGSLRRVNYANIALSGIFYYGINVQQDYKNGNSTYIPTAQIPITYLNLNNVHGSMSGDKNTIPVYILCGSGSCTHWTWSKVNINNAKHECSCNYKPSGYNC